MPKVLIVDDDIHLRRLVRTYAMIEGHTCHEAGNGREAIEKAIDNNVDIMVLDVLMPGIDGFETLKLLRRESQIPVILLTSRSEEYDKLAGFNMGADDYLTKPFSPKELMARIKTILKRSGNGAGSEITFGELIISEPTRSVCIAGKTLSLSPKEFNLLWYLVCNENIVLSREQLLNHVWGYDYFGDVRTIDTHIKSLREHLGEYRKYIKTAWGIGYKFEKN